MRGLGWWVASLVWVGVVSSSGAQSLSHFAPGRDAAGPRSAEYARVQERLATGWNTWDVHSVATQVLLPEGLAIRVGMKHNTGEFGDAFLGDVLIGSLEPGAPVVTPGPHAWDGSYTRADYEWKGHKWRVESAHDGDDLVMLVTPLASKSALPPTVVFSVGFVWNLGAGMVTANQEGRIVTTGVNGAIAVDCTCNADEPSRGANAPVDTSFISADLTGPVGLSAQVMDVANGVEVKPRTLEQIEGVMDRQRNAYETSVKAAGKTVPFWMRLRRRWGGTRSMSRRRSG